VNIKELQAFDVRAFNSAYHTWVEGDGQPDYGWYDYTIDSIIEDGKERGFMIGRRANESHSSAFYFSGFWSQGDGASWEGAVHLPRWIEHMEKAGVELPFTDAQLLWMREARRNGYIAETIGVQQDGYYARSHSMCLSGSLDVYDIYEGTDAEVLEGVFKGMNIEAFLRMGEMDLCVSRVVEKAVLSAAMAFADEWYVVLEKEFEYLTSEEYFIERMMDEDIEFDEEGNVVDNVST
jgi:hypothetical protein